MAIIERVREKLENNDELRRFFLDRAADTFEWARGLGLSFFGPAWSEPTLLALASAFERATTARRAPGFLARVEGEAV